MSLATYTAVPFERTMTFSRDSGSSSSGVAAASGSSIFITQQPACLPSFCK